MRDRNQDAVSKTLLFRSEPMILTLH
jgi:hypothetical protein